MVGITIRNIHKQEIAKVKLMENKFGHLHKTRRGNRYEIHSFYR